jgi:hypothetical protein
MPSMSSSISSSSADDPTVTVVIGSNAPQERLAACLTALEPQREGVEICVHEGAASTQELRARFPWASFVTSPGALVPFHWRDGIDAARGQIIALTISQMIPAPDWIARIRALHERYDVVGGAIDPGEELRLTDWAEYFCRYARDMRPFPGRESLDLPGDNAAYKRMLLESVRDSYRDGFWEPFVHRRLAEGGVVHWQDPELVVLQGRSQGAKAFGAQRLAHGRQYGRDRGASLSSAQRTIGVLASPIVPLVMSWRVLRLALGKKRHRARALATLPVIFWFNLLWAYAEARGYVDLLRDRTD